MISDKERREVARRLRSFVTDDSVNATVYASYVLHVLRLYYSDIDRIYFCGYDVARLADLIDPDCRDESFCNVCGHVIPDGWSECPRCKTKVVSDG